jgi:hypothetical protein
MLHLQDFLNAAIQCHKPRVVFILPHAPLIAVEVSDLLNAWSTKIFLGIRLQIRALSNAAGGAGADQCIGISENR